MKHPDHSQYCNCICPEGLSYEKLEETLNRVRMLHVSQERDGVMYCQTCIGVSLWGWQEWPCPTMMALSNDV